MKKLIDLAKELFEKHAHINEVHITSDRQAFATKGDAINHARGLTNKTIEVFQRDADNDLDLDDDADKPLDAKSIIALIDGADDEDEVKEFVKDDKRKTVLAAAAKRIAMLKQSLADEQAAAADLALKQRTADQPGSQDINNPGGE